LPCVEDPVLNTIPPLTPDVPAPGVDRVNVPDDVDALAPEEMLTAPPVSLYAAPAAIVNAPPAPDTPDPTVT
jgi:hypothetical protein